ncbi:hypothetical protein GBW32_20550 [Streptomyces tsukubensis]|uniref:hypothetical protein n=1 Tax=Streptomyces tsukubensis TaxID=83656 RepID=UPI001265E1D3|nr:hypothetical protein [Streptomyces tsukubensis]QFR94973.1 hypothetical protein GBW32_20550 [Streptomyces tsukubensis]
MRRGRDEPGGRYFADLDRRGREKEEAREAAERAYSKDVGVVRVISLVPPLLYCAAMIVGAASEGAAMFVLRYVLGPAGVVATAFMVWLILRYERSPERDYGVPMVVHGGALLGCLTGFATDAVAFVLIPLAAPLVQWGLPKYRTTRERLRERRRASDAAERRKP